ncbi:MAG TPA: sigma-70 family RNA polymerase sigma factor [Thermotogota bacterium]|jgi:RNA polymerase sigma-70 factor (ECF subfamily)|nr:sigma-70 family RNA polymerase sigma factor [Thermotogota bacterium]NLH18959.1 sigma-70 family RNA polymerase sigma factor [Thermotogaceae bacterium]OQC32767.1 MAG: ECF RNA polymerase sigma-E factor [Thermotogota bacterium ADurb.Bin062]HNW46639.1 sigma-70 family RNA polymerase sigma factor [Thermotogota bacterium]HNY82376.1 sigma-70 family RNA polymerase sigma factor [Thermotogota bacterium]
MPVFTRNRTKKWTDKELLENRRQIGDKVFWEEIYRRYASYLISIITFKYPDFRDVAEDITQETFLRLVFEDLDKVQNLKALLATTAAHICIDKHRLRSAKKRADTNLVPLDAELGNEDGEDSFLEITENVDSDNPEEIALNEIKVDEYRRVLSQLPEECQKLLMYSAEGMKYKEIANLMDLPIGTVGTKLLRCRERLKEIIEKENKEIEEG